MKPKTMWLTTDKPNDLLSLRQAAEILGVNRMWLSGYLLRDGSLHHTRNGLYVRRRNLARVPVQQKEA